MKQHDDETNSEDPRRFTPATGWATTPICGLRPTQWLIVIGVVMMVISILATERPLRIGQVLIVIGGAGIVLTSTLRQ